MFFLIEERCTWVCSPLKHGTCCSIGYISFKVRASTRRLYVFTHMCMPSCLQHQRIHVWIYAPWRYEKWFINGRMRLVVDELLRGISLLQHAVHFACITRFPFGMRVTWNPGGDARWKGHTGKTRWLVTAYIGWAAALLLKENNSTVVVFSRNKCCLLWAIHQ